MTTGESKFCAKLGCSRQVSLSMCDNQFVLTVSLSRKQSEVILKSLLRVLEITNDSQEND